MKRMAPRIIIFVLITVVLIIASFVQPSKKTLNNEKQDILVSKWDNMYNGQNIQFYYLNNQNENIIKYGQKNHLQNISDGSDDFTIIKNYLQWLSTKMNYNPNSDFTDKNAVDFEITEDEKINVGNRDLITLFNEGMAFFDIFSRTGVLREYVDTKKQVLDYYVSEVWDSSYKKWVMIDAVNGYCFSKDNIPMSSVEIINSQFQDVDIVDIINSNNKFVFINSKEKEKYINNMKHHFGTYTIAIDDNKHDEIKSNSYITYIKKDYVPQININNSFIKPTIFVNETKVFNMDPNIEYENDNSDEQIALIFGKGNLENDEEGVVNFIGGAFENSVQINNYFYSINESEWVKVGGGYFFSFDIVPGENVIKISKDGKTNIRKIVIQNNKEI